MRGGLLGLVQVAIQQLAQQRGTRHGDRECVRLRLLGRRVAGLSKAVAHALHDSLERFLGQMKQPRLEARGGGEGIIHPRQVYLARLHDGVVCERQPRLRHVHLFHQRGERRDPGREVGVGVEAAVLAEVGEAQEVGLDGGSLDLPRTGDGGRGTGGRRTLGKLSQHRQASQGL